MLIAVILGIPAGVIAAVRQGNASDYLARIAALIGLSVPHFWLGLLMITWFAVDLHWLPAGGYVSLHHPIGELAAHADALPRSGRRLRGGPVCGRCARRC